MTKVLEIGDILEIGKARLVYKGDNKADVVRFYPVSNAWKVDKTDQTLTDEQIAYWLGKK